MISMIAAASAEEKHRSLLMILSKKVEKYTTQR